jgi:hypothetical protein
MNLMSLKDAGMLLDLAYRRYELAMSWMNRMDMIQKLSDQAVILLKACLPDQENTDVGSTVTNNSAPLQPDGRLMA